YNPRLVLMTRDLVFWQDFALNVSQKLIGFIVAAGIAIFYRSYWALILGSAASQVVTLILSYAIRPYRPRLSMVHGRELLSFSVWLTLAQGVNTINWNLDKLVVGYVYGKAPLGIYTVGDNLAALPTREATSPIAQTLFPGFSIISGDHERLRHAYARAQGLLCAVAFPIGIGFAAAAHLIVPLALGPQWLGVILVIQVLAVVIALQTLAATLQPLAMALGETRLLFKRDLINLIIRLPLMGIGMLLAGFPGILYGRAAAAAVGTLINMHMVRQLIGMTIYRQLSNNTRLFAAAFAMIAAMMAIEAALGVYDVNIWAMTVFTCVAGGLGFVATAAGLWLVAGRPKGPESEIASAVSWAIVRVLPLIPFSRSPR
ncbi:MAG: lipopolysaccharide biosynthesis protein, partial [Oxalobacteraceae bacterium]